MNNFIAIFNDELIVQAFVHINPNNITFDILDESQLEKIKKIEDRINSKDLSFYAEISDAPNGIFTATTKKVSNKDPKFPKAVLQELQAQGLKASFVQKSLKDLLLSTHKPSVPITEREDMVKILLNLNENEASELVEILQNIKQTVEEIEKNSKI